MDKYSRFNYGAGLLTDCMKRAIDEANRSGKTQLFNMNGIDVAVGPNADFDTEMAWYNKAQEVQGAYSAYAHQPPELKTLADEVNEKSRKQNEKVLARSIKENIKYLEDAFVYAAARGLYKTMSDNLCDSRYREGSSYTQDEMEELLRDALIAHFEPLGFRWEGKGCNYLTLIWG